MNCFSEERNKAEKKRLEEFSKVQGVMSLKQETFRMIHNHLPSTEFTQPMEKLRHYVPEKAFRPVGSQLHRGAYK